MPFIVSYIHKAMASTSQNYSLYKTRNHLRAPPSGSARRSRPYGWSEYAKNRVFISLNLSKTDLIRHYCIFIQICQAKAKKYSQAASAKAPAHGAPGLLPFHYSSGANSRRRSRRVRWGMEIDRHSSSVTIRLLVWVSRKSSRMSWTEGVP